MDDGKDNLLESQGGEEPGRWQQVRTSRPERTDGGERRDVWAPGQGEIHFLEILLELYWHKFVRQQDDKVPFTDALIQRAHKESAAGNTIIFCHAASTVRSCNFFKNMPAQLR